MATPRLVTKAQRLILRPDGSLRLAVVADTHSQPHPRAYAHLAARAPDAILHAGDIGVRLLLVHIGVHGPKLRAEVATMARVQGAQVVVCGHSHVPFLGRDRGLTVFNPGSIGPRRFHLPIVFGTVDVTPTGLRLAHVDCETGAPWTPP